MTVDTSRPAVEALIAEAQPYSKYPDFCLFGCPSEPHEHAKRIETRLSDTLQALLDERDAAREYVKVHAGLTATDRESALQQRIRDLEATVDNLRLISNANGDWNIKYQEVNHRAERAEAELLHARGISEIRGAERDKLTARMERLSRMQPIYDAAQTVKGTGGAVEIGGVRIEPCDEFGATETTRERDRLAAELAQVKQCRDEYGDEIDVVNARWDKLTAKLDAVKAWATAEDKATEMSWSDYNCGRGDAAREVLAILADTDEGNEQ